MIDEQTVQDIESLLNLYPGVHSAKVFPEENREVFIRFGCESFSALKILACHATFNNLGINVGSVSDTGRDELLFSIQIDNDGNSDSPPTHSQRFGIFLVWDLELNGILPATRAEEMLVRWNGSRRKWEWTPPALHGPSDKLGEISFAATQESTTEDLPNLWTGDIDVECRLDFEGWDAHCARMGSFPARLISEQHPDYDPNNPFHELEHWYCIVNYCGECVYCSDVGGNLICGGQQARTICEAIINAARNYPNFAPKPQE